MTKIRLAAPVADMPTREKLFQEATRMFARQGYHGVSLRALAQVVGIQAGSIFHHFPGGKQQLFDELRSQILAKLAAHFQERIHATPEPVAAIVEITAMVWDYFAANPDSASLLLREAIEQAEAESAFTAQVQAIIEVAENYISKAQTERKMRPFQARAFMYWVGVYCLGFYGAPGLAGHIFAAASAGERAAMGRKQFLADVKAYLRM